MNIRSALTEPLGPSRPAYRYGMLAFILVLLGWSIQWHYSLPPGYSGDRYGGDVLVLMMLFNHLAYQFTWPIRVLVGLRILAWSWTGFGLFYVVSLLFC